MVRTEALAKAQKNYRDDQTKAGRRVVVGLDLKTDEDRAGLELLLAAGYESTASGVVRKAFREAVARAKRKAGK